MDWVGGVIDLLCCLGLPHTGTSRVGLQDKISFILGKIPYTRTQYYIHSVKM